MGDLNVCIRGVFCLCINIQVFQSHDKTMLWLRFELLTFDCLIVLKSVLWLKRDCLTDFAFFLCIHTHTREQFNGSKESALVTRISRILRMRSSLVVRASDCLCTSCNGPGFDPSIRRHSGIWGAADEAVLNIVRAKKKKIPQKNIKKKRIHRSVRMEHILKHKDFELLSL